MHIILKKSCENIEVLNIFYGDDENLIRNWIKEYINDDIESLKLCPLDKDIRSLSYETKTDKNITSLVRNIKRINRGYIYNSSERSSDIVYSIEHLEYDGMNKCNPIQYTLKENNKWSEINNEINNRVLRQLDKESLYQVLIKIQNTLKEKSNWNYTEYTSLIAEIIKSFKKELYSSIAKRLKKFGKKQKQTKNIQMINTAIEEWSGSYCHLESKKDKLD